MIKCEKKDLESILAYIGDEFGKCLYLYLDILKYGFENKNVNVWCQKSNENIVLITLQYYNGMHVFTKDIEKVNLIDLVKLLKERNPNMICGMGNIIRLLTSYFDNYHLEIGYVGQLVNLKDYSIKNCRVANEDDLKDIAEFMANDEALGKPYGFDLLYKQLVERYGQKYGRTFILEDNQQIVATASTYAEENKCAVVSGVLVDPNFRGRGLSKSVLTALCSNLKEEGYNVFSYYYIEQAIKMHKSVGFETLGEWAKLVKE